MKTPSNVRPVDLAVAGYEALVKKYANRKGEAFPAEKVLAEEWQVSQAAVNRAALRLIAAGVLQRNGYKLMPAPQPELSLAGARVAVLTHRAKRFPGIVEDGAGRGVQVDELFYIGRDTLRSQLRLAAERRYDGVMLRLSDGGWEWDEETQVFSKSNVPYIVCEEAPVGHNLVADDWGSATSLLVNHLASSGHQSIVFLGSLRRAHRSLVVENAYTETCLRLGLKVAAKQVQNLTAHTLDAMQESVLQMRKKFPSATAVVLFDVDLLESFLGAARRQKMRVPKDWSVVTVEDSYQSQTSQPPVTSAGFDAKVLGHVALDQIAQHILHVRRTGRLAARQRLRLEGTLRVRSSVQSLISEFALDVPNWGRETENLISRVWPQDRWDRLEATKETWLDAHPLAGRSRQDAFVPVNLKALANRSLTRQNGWLGHLPLLHFGPGRKLIHGVYFDILDENKNRGRAALVVQAHRVGGGKNRRLPTELSIPVGRNVKAIYFLHACGYVGESKPFAWYDVESGSGLVDSVPLVAKGLADPPPADQPQPNIQDWWPDFSQFTTEGVRSCVVTENGDPYNYERYLYSLEWLNPNPSETIERILVRAEPRSTTTLGILAVTLLLA